MPVTIADVAIRAGVARGTVSRVLNDHPSVTPEVRARVRAAIAELDYVPSAVARRLSLGRTQTIAVVVPFLTRPSVVERLRGIERELVRAELDMLVVNVESAERREAVLRQIARPERIDGLILVSIAPTDEELARIDQTKLPLVLIDAHHEAVPRIVVDDIGGGRLAARHVLDLGHRRIGFVGDIPEPGFGFTSTQLRLRGVRDAIREEGVEMPRELIGLGRHGRREAAESAGRLLALRRPPTAIIAASDTEAIGVIERARSIELEIPADLSVVGYDDIEAADFIGLTTIHQPLSETGERAVQKLIELIAGRSAEPRREVLPVTLVGRRTTSVPPV